MLISKLTVRWNVRVRVGAAALALAIGCGSVSSGGGPGSLRQPCYANHTCNVGLTCVSDVCVGLDAGLSGKGGAGAATGGAVGSGGASAGGSGGGVTGTGGGATGGDSGSGGSSIGPGGAGGGAAGAGGGAGAGGSAAGGRAGSGGSSIGGATGTGGVVATGGATGTGGVAGTGGAAGAGGTGIITCPSAFTATTGGWVLAPGSGLSCFHGYAYNFVDTVGSTIIPGTTGTYASCGAICTLTASGTLVASTGANGYGAYAGIGFNLNQPASGGAGAPTVTPKGSSLTVSYSSAGDLQAQISDGVTNWCHNMTTGTATIPYSAFNTKCYDSPPDGTPYAKQPISSFQLILVGSPTGGGYNFTLTSVVENP